jgi:hypothetical protein
MPKVRDILSQIEDSEEDSMVEFSLSISVSKIREILSDAQLDDDVAVCMDIIQSHTYPAQSDSAFLH